MAYYRFNYGHYRLATIVMNLLISLSLLYIYILFNHGFFSNEINTTLCFSYILTLL